MRNRYRHETLLDEYTRGYRAGSDAARQAARLTDTSFYDEELRKRNAAAAADNNRARKAAIDALEAVAEHSGDDQARIAAAVELLKLSKPASPPGFGNFPRLSSY